LTLINIVYITVSCFAALFLLWPLLFGSKAFADVDNIGLDEDNIDRLLSDLQHEFEMDKITSVELESIKKELLIKK
jgi:hypothetical protein